MAGLSLQQYQTRAATTAFYPKVGKKGHPTALAYITFGICGEAGEIAEQVKKSWREGAEPGRLTSERKEKVVEECGDVLWYISQMCSELDVSLEEVAAANLAKLSARAAQGKAGWSDQAKGKG